MTSTTASCWNRCFGKFEIVAETVESNNDELDKKVIALSVNLLWIWNVTSQLNFDAHAYSAGVNSNLVDWKVSLMKACIEDYLGVGQKYEEKTTIIMMT